MRQPDKEFHGSLSGVFRNKVMAQIEVPHIPWKGQEIARVNRPLRSCRREAFRQIQEAVLAADQWRADPSRQCPALGWRADAERSSDADTSDVAPEFQVVPPATH